MSPQLSSHGIPHGWQASTGLAPSGVTSEEEACLLLVEAILHGFNEQTCSELERRQRKLRWLAAHLPRTFTLLQVSRSWDSLFADEEVAW